MPRKLDLRTGVPVWKAYRAPSVPSANLLRDSRCDVLIIGMGISGAMIAEALSGEGHSIIAIDRRHPLAGSTSATTALVQSEIDQPLTSLSRQIGADKAARAWRRSRLAVANLYHRIDELGIRCQPQLRPSLYLAGNLMAAGELREEAEARHAIGLSCRYLTATRLKEEFRLERKAALLGYGNIALDPRRLAAGLLLAAQARGARFYKDTEATTITSTRDEVTVTTASGPTIRCAHLVLASGYELLDIVPPSRHRIVSTWALATRPQPNAIWPRQAFLWEASDPYLYMRATPDGRIICGGEDEDFQDEQRRDAMTDRKIAAIMRKLAALLPDVDTEPEYAWAGAFGTTSTGLPYIGAIPRHPRITAIMGYGGNGITYAQLASELVLTTLSGKDDTDADLYALDG